MVLVEFENYLRQGGGLFENCGAKGRRRGSGGGEKSHGNWPLGRGGGKV